MQTLDLITAIWDICWNKVNGENCSSVQRETEMLYLIHSDLQNKLWLGMIKNIIWYLWMTTLRYVEVY